MPKLKDDGYPKCVYLQHGTFYYVKNNKRTPLGKTEAEMWKAYEELIGNGGKTVAALVEKYKKCVIYGGEEPHAPDWAAQEERLLPHILEHIGGIDVHDVGYKHLKKLVRVVGGYSDETGRYKYLAKARHLKAMLSGMWKWAIDWEFREPGENPVSFIKLPKLKARALTVQADEVFWPVFNHVHKRMKIALLFFRGTGIRSGDLRRKLITEIDENGIKNEQHKRKKSSVPVRQFFKHNAYTLLAMQISAEVRREFNSLFLIPKQKNRTKPYDARSFYGMWEDEMEKCIKDGIIREDQYFAPHMVRKMAGTDQKNKKKTSELLGNTLQVAGEHYFFGYEEVVNEAAPQRIEDILKHIGTK